MSRPALAALALLLGAPGCGPPPELSALEDSVFAGSCIDVDDCHAESAEEGGLVLEAGFAFGELVNVPAEGDPDDPESFPSMPVGEVRVIPGDPEGSFLMKKLEGDLLPQDGARMPNMAGVFLSGAEINAIREWIARGAADD